MNTEVGHRIELYKLIVNKMNKQNSRISSYGALKNKVAAVDSFDLRIGTTLFAELLIFYCVLCAMGQHASAVPHFL